MVEEGKQESNEGQTEPIRVSLDSDGPIRLDMAEGDTRSDAQPEREMRGQKQSASAPDGVAVEAEGQGSLSSAATRTYSLETHIPKDAGKARFEAASKSATASAWPPSYVSPADAAYGDAAASAAGKPTSGGAGTDSGWTGSLRESYELLHRIVDNIETVLYGKRNVVELVLMAIVARGHVLIEDVPGVGKTSLVSALAKSISCNFNRIQFTPDVMPSDVSGFSIFNQKTREFEFRPGGVMANIVLADEINRASAKPQSALLEVMEGRQVTVDANTYKMEEPFMVLATQNPIEQFGTFPLPEAQIDRFLIKTSIGYPAFTQEMRIIREGRASKRNIRPVARREEIVAASQAADGIHISPQVERYIVEIVTATRNSAEIEIGSSPRGTIALADLSRAYALYQGRSYVIPDDVKYLVGYVLGHRISISHSAAVEGRTPQDVLDSIVSSIAVPITAKEAQLEAEGKALR